MLNIEPTTKKKKAESKIEEVVTGYVRDGIVKIEVM